MEAQRVHRSGAVAALAAGLLGALLVGCGGQRGATVARTWVVGQVAPRFDPYGAPEPVRWALERLLTRGLVAEDTSGRIVPAAAESVGITTDGLVYTFRLRPGLTFTDGSACASSDFRRALESGLNRLDHGTQTWLLSSVVGVESVRSGRPLPPLGIATPDARTLILRLARPDSLLLHKLALPGVGTPWAKIEPPGRWETPGLGDYKVSVHEASRMTLLKRRRSSAGPDTLKIRFVPGVGRARALLRAATPDLLWPVPPGLLAQELPSEYLAIARPARPTRRLVLVMRPDLPPTSKPAARHALAHGLNRGELLALLGPRGSDLTAWLPGGTPFEFPKRDPEEVQAWLARGKIGRSLHVVMAYSADGAAAEVARPMQIEWAKLGLDVELRPLAAPVFGAEGLRPGGAQLWLIESQSLLEDPAVELATLVMPARGPAVGSFRTGWRTREFDRWIGPGASRDPVPVEMVQQRLADDTVVLPLASLPWLWVARSAGLEMGFHPRFGPEARTVTRLPSRR